MKQETFESIAEGVTLERDIVYNQDPPRPLTLHLLRPVDPANQPRPAIAYFFGGAFRHGSKELPPITRTLKRTENGTRPNQRCYSRLSAI